MNKPFESFGGKLNRYLRRRIVNFMYGSRSYKFLYPSVWHLFFSPRDVDGIDSPSTNYLSAVPNPGAGIGHQFANWNAGFWFSKYFNLKFAHIPFSDSKWERLLGVGHNEELVDELIQHRGYKLVHLPMFDENRKSDLDLIRRVIDSYKEQKTVFILERDQFYGAQIGVEADLKRKFYENYLNQISSLIYKEDCLSVAIHVRRGDVDINSTDVGIRKRWIDEAYFLKLAQGLAANLVGLRVRFYIFSQSSPLDLAIFNVLGDVEFCTDMDQYSTFLHFIHSDILICSRSSFSYKAGLLSNGLKIAPNTFWHEYPSRNDWWVSDEFGLIDFKSFSKFAIDLGHKKGLKNHEYN